MNTFTIILLSFGLFLIGSIWLLVKLVKLVKSWGRGKAESKSSTGTTPAPHGDGETGGGHAHSDKRSMWWYVLFLGIGYFLVIDVIKVYNWHSAAQVKQAQSQLVNAKFAEDPSNWIWSFQCVDAPGDPIRGDIGEARIFERGLSRDDKGITYLRFWHTSGSTGNQVIYVWHRGQGGTYNDGRRDFSFTLDPSSNEQCLSGTLEDLDGGVLKRYNWLMKPLRFIPPKPRP